MDSSSKQHGSTFSATLLVTGCCMGVGMIGLPVVSALAGFIPSTLAMIFCYIFAVLIGFLLVEATLWFDHPVNLISLSQFALGKWGKLITWSFFLFLFYCIFVAYIDGISQLIGEALSNLLNISVPRTVGILICVPCIGALVYMGTRAVSIVNQVFLLISILSFCTLITLGLPKIQGASLLRTDWKATIATIPILLICFGYQNLIPTLVHFAKRNIYTIRCAILIGSLIPFIVYSLWNFVILGLLTKTDTATLTQLIQQNNMATGLLANASHAPAVLLFTQIFSFFAIITPFMANTLAFVDFLKDGLKIPHNSERELRVYILALGPPTLLTLLYPNLFLRALGFAGGFADIVLFAIMPTIIVWTGRYMKKIKGPYELMGGKPMLIAILLISFTILFIKKG